MIQEIENPWYSRTIDVHTWSDHPEVAQFVDRVWEEGHLPDDVVKGKTGPSQPRAQVLHLKAKFILSK
ncbi:hypothetical protein C1J03_19265 [Sulfitobacter sp. SK012]|nr:hypothetical protein C1J03_19265 [Sulfitobacter sp. SK012]